MVTIGVICFWIVSPAQKRTTAAPDHLRTKETSCQVNPDKRYNRDGLLKRFDEELKANIPTYAQFSHKSFFIIDLNEPSNRFIPAEFAAAQPCIEFIEGHIYHFAPVSLVSSQSHVAILKGEQIMFFKSLNCPGGDKLERILSSVEGVLRNHNKKKEIINRVRSYRDYGYYIGVDETGVSCHEKAN